MRRSAPTLRAFTLSLSPPSLSLCPSQQKEQEEKRATFTPPHACIALCSLGSLGTQVWSANDITAAANASAAAWLASQDSGAMAPLEGIASTPPPAAMSPPLTTMRPPGLSATPPSCLPPPPFLATPPTPTRLPLVAIDCASVGVTHQQRDGGYLNVEVTLTATLTPALALALAPSLTHMAGGAPRAAALPGAWPRGARLAAERLDERAGQHRLCDQTDPSPSPSPSLTLTLTLTLTCRPAPSRPTTRRPRVAGTSCARSSSTASLRSRQMPRREAPRTL